MLKLQAVAETYKRKKKVNISRSDAFGVRLRCALHSHRHTYLLYRSGMSSAFQQNHCEKDVKNNYAFLCAIVRGYVLTSGWCRCRLRHLEALTAQQGFCSIHRSSPWIPHEVEYLLCSLRFLYGPKIPEASLIWWSLFLDENIINLRVYFLFQLPTDAE